MADHRSLQIRDAIKTLITGLATTGSRVYVGRSYELPAADDNALSLRLGELAPVDNDGYSNVGYADSLQEFIIRIHCKGSEADLDGAFLLIHKEVYTALMVDHTLGLAFVHDIVSFGFAPPIYESSSDRPTVSVDSRWRVMFRHSLTDISA